MSEDSAWNETLVEKELTYHIELDGRLFLIENATARVNVETGEKQFVPETVERGASLLHLAMPRWAEYGGDQTTGQQIAMASLLIDRVTHIDTIGDGGETPLGYTGWLGMKRFARYLFERGADPTVTTEWGFDAPGTIADHGHVDPMEMFAEAGVPMKPRHLVQTQMAERLDALEDADLHARCDIGHFDGERGTLMRLSGREGSPWISRGFAAKCRA